MLLYFLVAFCIASTTSYKVSNDSDEYELRWAESYSVRATKFVLTSNFVEDISAWKTNQSSRVDYNQGAVKVISTLSKDGDGLPQKFEIHPETTNEELNKIVCHFSFDSLISDDLDLDGILPSVTDDEIYEAVGNETVEDDLFTTKFEYVEKNREEDIRKTIWADYITYEQWTPVKYEVKTYNTILGVLTKHEIWKFYDYFPNDVDEDVFDTDKYDCENETAIEHAADSKKVTKELLLINPDNEKHVDHIFSHFKKSFNRNYAHENEHALRKSIFRKNMRMISRTNRRNLTYKLGINQFSDWTPAEMKKSLGVIPRPEGLKATVPFPYEEDNLKKELDKLPKEYDMRTEGLISPVKNQGECGSCWTFAAAAVMEGGLARINGGRVLSLSNQAIIDCAYEDLAVMGAGGCNGGYDYAAYNFIIKHGLPTDQEYGPYKMRDGYCHIGNMSKTYSIQGYTEVTKYSTNAMKVAVVNHGPLYIYVHVSDEFASYSSGIFYQTEEQCNPERPNHAIALVGYGESYGDLFWILKNSYGDTWGEDGYILISAKDNVCGVTSNPTYPVF